MSNERVPQEGLSYPNFEQQQTDSAVLLMKLTEDKVLRTKPHW